MILSDIETLKTKMSKLYPEQITFTSKPDAGKTGRLLVNLSQEGKDSKVIWNYVKKDQTEVLPSHDWSGFKCKLAGAMGNACSAALSGKTISAMALTLALSMLF